MIKMSRKLALSPDVSYMLGLCTIGREEPYVSVITQSDEVIERFVRIAVNSLEIDTKKILIVEKADRFKQALFYNSTTKRLFLKALEEREQIFKYKNEYSASYFAGLYDSRGQTNYRSITIKTRDMVDVIILERLNFRITRSGMIKNHEGFRAFIKPYSALIKS